MKTKNISLIFLLLCLNISVFAQQTATTYFLDHLPMRHLMNPAFQAKQSIYIAPLPNLYMNGSSDLTFNDFFDKGVNNETRFIFSPGYPTSNFYNALPKDVLFSSNVNLHLLGFGFRLGKGYIHAGMQLKVSTNNSLSKDLFKFMLFGTPDENAINHYDFSNLHSQAQSYISNYVGYSYQINEKVTVGATFKYLYGLANYQTDFKKMNLDASREAWTLDAEGSITGSAPIEYTYDSEGDIDQKTIEYKQNGISPVGNGVGFDLGVVYQPIDHLEVSASIIDLGFINWNNNIEASIKGRHEINELVLFNLKKGDDELLSASNSLSNLGDALSDEFTFKEKEKSYNTALPTKINLAAKYGILSDKIEFGALFSTQFTPIQNYTSFTLSSIFNPFDMLQGSLAYTATNYGTHSLGAALNFDFKYFDFFIASDFISLTWSKVQSENMTILIPQNHKVSNFEMGCSFAIHSNKETKEDYDVREKSSEEMDTLNPIQ